VIGAALAALLLLLAGREAPAAGTVTLTLFYGQRCSSCAKEEAFLAKLTARTPGLVVRALEVELDERNARLLAQVAEAYGVRPAAVPATFVGEFDPVIGYRDDATTGAAIEERVRACLERRCEDRAGELLRSLAAGKAPLVAAGEGGRGAAPADSVLTLPLLGRTDLAALPLLALTVVLGALDSFNPCAFFVLFTLLGILVHARSRGRMLFIGGTFVLSSGVVYFLFMAAWLNLFLHLGELRFVTVAAGVVALAIAAINIKDYFLFHRGVSLMIPEGRKPGLFARMRALLAETSYPALVVGTLVLALAANTYELLCTAGFPMVFTRVLTLHRLPPAGYYLYLALYNAVYVVPLAGIVGVFALTLGARKLTEEQGRVMKLVSGLMMLGLGVVVLVEPALFNNALVGVGLLAAAALVAAVIVRLGRRA
jgi:hypothetical protein